MFVSSVAVRKWLRATLACGVASWNVASAAVYLLPSDGSAVIGQDGRTRSTREDTLLDIARRHGIGYEEMVRANPGVNVWLPGDNTVIVLPGRHILPSGPREGIVVNLPEHRLYFYPKPRAGEHAVVVTYPVSIGSVDWQSPLGRTRIVSKERHPQWVPTAAIRREHAAEGDFLPRIVPAGPNNPLGDFKMRLAIGNGTYEIHATNIPMAIGMAVTHGCISMYPEDLADLFPLVPVGTEVLLVNEPVKSTYVNGNLLLEVHPSLETDARATNASALQPLAQMLEHALGAHPAAIQWDFARQVIQAAFGMPTVVGLGLEPAVTAQAH